MKSGDLKALVIRKLHTDLGLSIKEITKLVNKKSNKVYAYTTISTVLSRLVSQEVVLTKKAKLNGRRINLYFLSEKGFKNEISQQLQNVILKFGFGGVKHLGELLDKDIDEDELKLIKAKLEKIKQS